MKIVFLDRDGTMLVDPVDERVDTDEELVLFPDSIEAMKHLADNDFAVIIITNQAGIGEGLLDVEGFNRLHNKFIDLLNSSGVKILKTYMCPHNPTDGCDCRKPSPKMLLNAAKEFDIDLKNTYMVGDRYSDILAGVNAGTKTILVKTGNVDVEAPEATYTAPNLLDAVRYIVANG